MNNSEFIINFLQKKGLNTAFGITGGGAMFLNEAFRKQKNLNFIFMHHEQAAAMAAETSNHHRKHRGYELREGRGQIT